VQEARATGHLEQLRTVCEVVAKSCPCHAATAPPRRSARRQARPIPALMLAGVKIRCPHMLQRGASEVTDSRRTLWESAAVTIRGRSTFAGERPSSSLRNATTASGDGPHELVELGPIDAHESRAADSVTPDRTTRDVVADRSVRDAEIGCGLSLAEPTPCRVCRHEEPPRSAQLAPSTGSALPKLRHASGINAEAAPTDCGKAASLERQLLKLRRGAPTGPPAELAR
jgi:hypothetical protein